jgi:hypothetical protein
MIHMQLLNRGNYIHYKFDVLAQPQNGFQRSFVFQTSGYYLIYGPEVSEDKIDNLPFVEGLVFTPYAYSQWILPR